MTRLIRDHTLHLIVNVERFSLVELRQVVGASIEGGVTVVQLRCKEAPIRTFIRHGAALRRLLEGADIPLIIDDRVDVALVVGADGVHLGLADMPIELASRVLGAGRNVGATLTSGKRVLPQRSAAAATYAGVGPVFPTRSKTDAPPPMGLAVLREIVAGLTIPAVAIGGITPENAASVVAAGASGIVVISAICEARDPRAAARRLVEAVRSTSTTRT